MTNNWSDIGNATLIVVMGANPVENHPACAAHINRARFPKDFFPAPDPRANKKEADLIVIDPRKTRTALQVDPNRPGDRYVRIRPGTDIAFINGVVKYVIDQMESATSSVPAGVKSKFFAYLNQGSAKTTNQTFYTNRSTSGVEAAATAAAVKFGSKYTDARFIVNPAGTDYARADVTTDGFTAVTTETPTQIIYNFPQKAATCDSATDDTVYNKLKAHVAPYTLATVANICGCSTTDIAFVGDAYIANSRCSSGATPDADGNWPTGASGEDPRGATYRATTMLYAMGVTQHTCGAQNVKSFAVLQTLLGNMGRAGGGINALRGIHNVQGSTDMGVLYGNIPAYSGNPNTQPTAIPDTTTNAFGKYMDALWGIPLSGTGTRGTMNGSYDDAYYIGRGALQQQGFFNMTRRWFGPSDDGSVTAANKGLPLIGDNMRTQMDAAYSLWPKGNGHNHVKMFREMAAGNTTVAVVWGQNPAVTEPNQSAIRDGLKRVKLLVCVDIFETETAAVQRRVSGDYGETVDGVTYLIPSCSHVEKAGSAANSGRVLQWRYQAAPPKGDSKDDTHLLLMLAKALDDNPVVDGGSAFSHIKAVWDTGAYSIPAYTGSVYDNLYGYQYGWDGVSDFNTVSVTGDYVTSLGTLTDATPTYSTTATLTGSEAVAELIYRQMTGPVGNYGTIWIYTSAYNTSNVGVLLSSITYTAPNTPANSEPRLQANYVNSWYVANRSKSRDRLDPYGTFGFHKWGYSWLVNRRVLYNNSEVPGDQADFFMTAESQSRMFVPSSTPALLDYSRWYRTYHKLNDTPRKSDNTVPAIHVLPGKFPAHVEPYESPRADLVTTWGKNATVVNAAFNSNGASTYMNLLTAGTAHANDDTVAYPLVLTTIRCVEHFQGGPITRNNWWNVEQEPEPWIEINSADALLYGIKDGDRVNVITARSNSTTDQQARTLNAPGFAKGFIARVGAGLQANQRVGRGVVAIPWHWGDRGLSTGSRANDLCIDAGDANTYIPESKACLCKIVKL